MGETTDPEYGQFRCGTWYLKADCARCMDAFDDGEVSPLSRAAYLGAKAKASKKHWTPRTCLNCGGQFNADGNGGKYCHKSLCQDRKRWVKAHWRQMKGKTAPRMPVKQAEVAVKRAAAG